MAIGSDVLLRIAGFREDESIDRTFHDPGRHESMWVIDDAVRAAELRPRIGNGLKPTTPALVSQRKRPLQKIIEVKRDCQIALLNQRYERFEIRMVLQSLSDVFLGWSVYLLAALPSAITTSFRPSTDV